MKVGGMEIVWDMGVDAGADLLEAIGVLARTRGIKIIEGENFHAQRFDSDEKVEAGYITVTLTYPFYGV